MASGFDVVRRWLTRHFSDPQVVGLAVVLLSCFAIVWWGGNMLAPVIASVIIAYLLEGLVGLLERLRVPRLLAVLAVFTAFMTFLIVFFFGLFPTLTRQATQLIQQLPQMILRGQDLLLALPEKYPDLFSQSQVKEYIAAIRSEILQFGQVIVSRSVASVVGLIALIVYLVLVPLLVFFFLKDKQRLVNWFTAFLPKDRELIAQVWHDVDLQIGNYIRGKFVEILIVWLGTYVVFAVMGMQFSMLLAVAVGISVLIPYIGAVVVTFPVAIVAYSQWGVTPDFWWLIGAYFLVQGLDGVLLVPILFSEVVNLHPVAIVVAILVFGGLWGFWGVFFAIPLATLVQAVMKSWPSIPTAARPPTETPPAQT